MPVVSQIFAGELVENSQNLTAAFTGADYLFMKAPGPLGDRPDWSADGSFVEIDCAVLVQVEPGFKRQVPISRNYISNREPLIIPREVSRSGFPLELVLQVTATETVEIYAVSTETNPTSFETPWVFSQSEPSIDSVWWEIDSDGLPLYEYPWRWNQSVERWLSERSFIVSASGSGSNFKSGRFSGDFPLVSTEYYAEKADFRFYLDTNRNDVDWLVELNELDGDWNEIPWVSVQLAGEPLREARTATLPIGQLRPPPEGGWGWKLSPVRRRGSVNLEAQIVLREVRPGNG